MNNSINKNFLILFGMFIVASGTRFILNTNHYITNIIAAINIISLWYVTYIVIDNIENIFKTKLDNIKFIGNKVKKKKEKSFKYIFNAISVFLLIIGLVYIFVFANSIANDIIALWALFLSIETECICTFVSTIFINRK